MASWSWSNPFSAGPLTEGSLLEGLSRFMVTRDSEYRGKLTARARREQWVTCLRWTRFERLRLLGNAW